MTKQATLFEGNPVANGAVKITKAHRLDLAMPTKGLQEEAFFVVRGTVVAVNHISKEGVVTREHTIEATEIGEIRAADAMPLLSEAEERLQRAHDAMTGQQRLDDVIRSHVDQLLPEGIDSVTLSAPGVDPVTFGRDAATGRPTVVA